LASADAKVQPKLRPTARAFCDYHVAGTGEVALASLFLWREEHFLNNPINERSLGTTLPLGLSLRNGLAELLGKVWVTSRPLKNVLQAIGSNGCVMMKPSRERATLLSGEVAQFDAAPNIERSPRSVSNQLVRSCDAKKSEGESPKDLFRGSGSEGGAQRTEEIVSKPESQRDIDLVDKDN
jgi:hypothetical protein